MKQILLFGAIALSTLTFGQNVPSYVPTNGLVGWWPFNGNANDESGNGNNGTVTDANLTLDRNSVSNSAYNFDYAGYSNGQIDDIILIPHNSSFSTTEMSISFWFKADLYDYSGNPGHSAIIKRSENGYSNPPGEFWYSILDASSKKITCGVNDENRNGISVSSSNNSINLNTWYHVVMTYDNIELKLYLDGTLVDQISKANGLRTTGTSGISIGVSKQANGYWRPFDGIIDDFGLWNTGLTSQEVTDLYNASTCQTPTATITPQGNTSFCQGNSVVLEATSGSNYTYEWYKNGNIISNASTSSYQATSSGSYTVKVIDGVCSETSTATVVTVNSTPSNSVSNSGNTTFCSGESINLTAQGTGSYLWSNGETSQSINITESGNYSVTVTQNNCTATSSETVVTVNPSPTATISPQSATTFCEGGFVELVASGGDSYQWNTGSQTSTLSVNQSGNYTVNVFNQYNCQATASQNVTVNSNPIVTFTLPNLMHNENGNYNLNGSPSGGTYTGNGITGNVFDPFSVGLGKQTIVYDYTDNNGCSGSASATTIIYDTTGTVCTSYVSVSVTDTLIIDVSLAGLTAPNNINTMKVYPNPSNDVVNIDNGDYALMNGYSIKIININAQEVFNSIINSQIIQIPVSQLGATGNYFINIYDNNLLLIESKILVLQ